MWLQVIEALKDIPLCHLPRYIGITQEKSVVYSLVDLIFSKTRLVPQNMTIPRLELMGVLIGVRALKFVTSELHLQSKKPLSAFVTNRLKEIKSLKEVTFKHVSSEDNPADLATRGKSPRELTSSIWWMGPTWLKKP
ncbi:uncharacterized protein [Dysidea avara]|uniref:uncharacterized protein n=1 Tax=Dysidea avara TaxID=196820 RepID=UPI003329B5C0